MKFRILAERNAQDQKYFVYDNETNTLSTEDGFVLEYPQPNGGENRSIAKTFSRDDPLLKSQLVTHLKIQLGLSCNYACDYCSQRFVERAPETSKKDIDAFMAKLEHLQFDEEKGLQIEMWGGEPLVYWKTLQPLTEALKQKFAGWKKQPKFLMITNGSLLKDEICDWLYDNNFSVAISHDAMGQFVRGPDPFDEPGKKDIILNFYRRMRGRMSFNSMLTAKSFSRKAISDWFRELTGEAYVPLGEGGLIDAYDEGGEANSLQTKAQHFEFRRTAFNDIYSTQGDIGFGGILQKIDHFTHSVLNHIPADTLGQKCGMDDEHTIAIDLRGDVITCQNVSGVEIGMNGENHKSGNITEIEAVRIKTATHWRNRPDCSNCMVVHLCKGACMFLEGAHWETSCDHSFSDNVAFFALSFEKITNGYIPVYVDADHLPADRRDIWGTQMQHEEKPKRKIIPIAVSAAKKIVNDVEVFEKARA